MADWTNDNQTGGELFAVSDSGYTNDELGLQWLAHFIKHVGATAGGPTFVLMCDSHTSHINDDFDIEAEKHNIWPYRFPSHLTHILQPLDVAVFHPYKHWHNKAIAKALREGQNFYGINDFLYDLKDIRDLTFKDNAILRGWRDSDLWPIMAAKTLAKMKVYEDPVLLQPDYITGNDQLDIPKPKSAQDAVRILQSLAPKIQAGLSSPTGAVFTEFQTGTEEILYTLQLTSNEYTQLHVAMKDRAQRKLYHSRQRIQKGGVLIAGEAQQRKNQRKIDYIKKIETSHAFHERVARNKVLLPAKFELRVTS